MFRGLLEYFFPCCFPKLQYVSFAVASDFETETSSEEEEVLFTIEEIDELSDSDI